MFVLWILLWTVAFVLLYANFRSSNVRWAAAVCLASGCGGLAVLTDKVLFKLLPGLHEGSGKLLVVLLASIGHYAAPYALLGFALSFFHSRYGTAWLTLAAIPPVASLLYYFSPQQFSPSFLAVTAWVAPYVLAANGMLVAYWLKGNTRRERWTRFLIVTVTVPATTFSLMTNYILRVMGFEKLWMWNVWIIGAQFVCIAVFLVRYGFLGIRIHIERESMPRKMRIAGTGTSLLNHTIKNEIAKIDLLADKMKRQMEGKGSVEWLDDLQHIQASVDHLRDVSARVYGQTQIVRWRTEETHLAGLLQKVLSGLESVLEQRSIRVHVQVDSGVWLDCDPAHLAETVSNLLSNSIEAMSKSGSIHIELLEKRKSWVLSLKDNGSGIPEKHLPYVFEPYYSTKRTPGNFGLGLSYCYNVMQTMGGTLKIESKEGAGTSLQLVIPATKIIRKDTE